MEGRVGTSAAARVNAGHARRERELPALTATVAVNAGTPPPHGERPALTGARANDRDHPSSPFNAPLTWTARPLLAVEERDRSGVARDHRGVAAARGQQLVVRAA